MSCKCGCHDNTPPATGWRRYVPLIMAVAVAGAIIAGALLKKDATDKGREPPRAVQSAATPSP